MAESKDYAWNPPCHGLGILALPTLSSILYSDSPFMVPCLLPLQGRAESLPAPTCLASLPPSQAEPASMSQHTTVTLGSVL